MKIMPRDDVEVCSDGYRQSHPAVNVKVYHFVTTEKVKDRFHCSETVAERALGFCFESGQEQFWEEIQELAVSIFGQGVKVYSEGRSGGWAVVHGLPDVEDWNGRDLLKWTRFAHACKLEVSYLTSWDYVQDMIEANEWATPDLKALQDDAADTFV